MDNLSSSEIADELDSRLRDLEKNISVAREFIKLADESYSELRHKWNLLQEEARNQSQTTVKKESLAKDAAETSTVKTSYAKNRVKAPVKSSGFAPKRHEDASLEPTPHKTKATSKPEKEATIPKETMNPSDETITRKHRDGERKHKKPAD